MVSRRRWLRALPALLSLVLVTTLGPQPPHATAQSSGASIGTNKPSYQVGETLQYCFTLPGPGLVRVTDQTPDGRTQVVLTQQDDGRGGCKTGQVTPPAGQECLRLEWSGAQGRTATAQTCFQVVAAPTPLLSPPPVPPSTPGNTFVPSTPPSAQERLVGGQDRLDDYCRSQGFTSAAVLTWERGGIWNCSIGARTTPQHGSDTPGSTNVPINLDDSCRWQYPSVPGVVARQTTPGNPFTWSCFTRDAGQPVPAARVPRAPSTLVVTATGSTTVALTWTDNSDNESGFEFSDNLRPAIKVGPNTTTATVPDLPPNTRTCYHVRAFNDAGSSDWTEYVCTTTPPTPSLPPTPSVGSAAVTLNPSSGPAASSVRATGGFGSAGFPGCYKTPFDVAWDGQQVVARGELLTAGELSDGRAPVVSVGIAFTVPQGATPGAHTVLFRASPQGGCQPTTTTLTATFTVTSSPPSDQASITTDKSQYQVGESIRICYTVPGSGSVTITDTVADGRTQVFFSGSDDGRGDCRTGTVTEPLGQECLRLQWSSSDGRTATAQACFQVTSTTPSSSVPRPPTNLTVTASGPTSVVLAWTDNADNEQGFELSDNLRPSLKAAANTTTASVTDLPPNTRTCYHVRAFNDAGSSDWTEYVCTTTPPASGGGTASASSPRPPSNLTVAAANSTSVVLAWTDNADNESGFELSDNLRPSIKVTANTTTFLVPDLPANTRTCYHVRAFNDAGFSNWTDYVCATTPPSGGTDTASITTDKSQYQVGETVHVCYTVPGSGSVTITDTLADGRTQVFLSGTDDGRGDCRSGSVTEPTGTECLRLEWTGSGRSSSAQACFQVVSGGTTGPGGTISVPATQPWTDTGIDLTEGFEVTITASGSIQVGIPISSSGGPAGDPTCQGAQGTAFVAPGLPCWSLIGRIGNGAPFLIGASTKFTVSTPGRLYLGVNDEQGAFQDNSGAWSALVIWAQSSGGTPPTRFFGTVTVNGQPALDGDTLLARVGNTVCGSSAVAPGGQGSYTIDVASAVAQSGCGTPGATVTFTVRGTRTNQTGTFQSGSFVQLNLTVPDSAGVVTVEDFFASDAAGNRKTTFSKSSGEVVYLRATRRNTAPSAVMVRLETASIDVPEGSTWGTATDTSEVAIPPGVTIDQYGVRWNDGVVPIPSNAPVGTYTVRYRITYNGQTSERTTTFTIVNDDSASRSCHYVTVEQEKSRTNDIISADVQPPTGCSVTLTITNITTLWVEYSATQSPDLGITLVPGALVNPGASLNLRATFRQGDFFEPRLDASTGNARLMDTVQVIAPIIPAVASIITYANDIQDVVTLVTALSSMEHFSRAAELLLICDTLGEILGSCGPVPAANELLASFASEKERNILVNSVSQVVGDLSGQAIGMALEQYAETVAGADLEIAIITNIPNALGVAYGRLIALLNGPAGYVEFRSY